MVQVPAGSQHLPAPGVGTVVEAGAERIPALCGVAELGRGLTRAAAAAAAAVGVVAVGTVAPQRQMMLWHGLLPASVGELKAERGCRPGGTRLGGRTGAHTGAAGGLDVPLAGPHIVQAQTQVWARLQGWWWPWKWQHQQGCYQGLQQRLQQGMSPAQLQDPEAGQGVL